MNARQRVLAAYGNACAWCQSTAGLEIDHLHGGGNHHRAQIRLPLATWLVREHQRLGYWPTGFQLLCQACHDRKSGRRPAMPPRKGATALNISLPDHLASQLAVLAAAPEHHNSKSQVLETALRAFIEGGANLTALDTVHHQIATLGAALGQQSQEVHQSVQTLTSLVQTLITRVTALEERFTAFAADQVRRYEDLQGAYDRLKSSQTATERGGSWRGFRSR